MNDFKCYKCGKILKCDCEKTKASNSAGAAGYVYSADSPVIENAAVAIDVFFEQYIKDGKAGTYSKNLRKYLAKLLNDACDSRSSRK